MWWYYLKTSNKINTSKEVISIDNFFIIILLYGVLGFVGIKISKKVEIPRIWYKKKVLKILYTYLL